MQKADLNLGPGAALLYFFYFYPVGINRKQHRKPLLSWGLMLFMLVAFVWFRYFPQIFPLDPADLIFYPGNGRPWTALTAVFLHSGWLHLMGNLVYFNVFGPVLESRVGGGLFLFYFLIIGVFGNLVHGLVAAQGWFGQFGVGVLGASGAIAGLLAFNLVRFHNAKVQVAWWVFAPLMGQNRAGRSGIPMAAAVLLWLLLQVVHSLVASQTGAGVSYGAHFGGFVMGLMIALSLGQWHEGRLENLRCKAGECFRDGVFHASVGLWLDYLELVPEDVEARLELARARIMTEQLAAAELDFRKAFHRYLAAGDIPSALAVFQEAKRANLVRSFPIADLARVAHYQEKQMDYRGAAKTHEYILYRHGEGSEGQRSLVRLVVLHRGKIDDPDSLRHWTEMAKLKLPRGGWREFLDAELRQEGGLGGGGTRDLAKELLPDLLENLPPPGP